MSGADENRVLTEGSGIERGCCKIKTCKNTSSYKLEIAVEITK